MTNLDNVTRLIANAKIIMTVAEGDNIIVMYEKGEEYKGFIGLIAVENSENLVFFDETFSTYRTAFARLQDFLLAEYAASDRF